MRKSRHSFFVISALVIVSLLLTGMVSCTSKPSPTAAPQPTAAPTAAPKPAAPTAAPTAAPGSPTAAPKPTAAAATATPVPAKPTAAPTAAGKPSGAVVNWKYASYIPAQTTVGKVSVWMLSELDKRSQGRLKIEPYWNASLAPVVDFPRMLKSNLVQMALIGPQYNPDVFKLTRGFGIQYGATSIGAPADAFAYAVKTMVENYAPLKKEFQDAGIMMLADNTGPELLVYATKPVWKWEELRGSRVRIYGSKSLIWKEWGASTLNIPFNEVYQALQTGVINTGTGLMFASQAGMKFYEVAPYVIDPRFGGDIFPEAISMQAFAALPQDLKDVVLSVGKDYPKQKFAIEEADAKAQIEQLKDKTWYVRWTQKEVERGIAQGKGIELKTWMDEMKGYGLPGDEFWNTFQSSMKEYMANNKSIWFNPMESLCKEGGMWHSGVYTPPPGGF